MKVLSSPPHPPFLFSTLATLLTNPPPFQILQPLLVALAAAATVAANPIPASSGTEGDTTALAAGVYSCRTQEIRRQCVNDYNAYCDKNGQARSDYASLCSDGGTGNCVCEAGAGGGDGCHPIKSCAK